MRILIITTQYYPVLNPNVYRWGAIAEYWAAQGHDIHILCSKRSELPDNELLNSVIIHRTGQATLLDWVYNTFRFKQRRSEKGHQVPQKGSRSKQFLEKIIDWTWRKLYWPDGSCIWYLPARKRAKQVIKTAQIEAIITVGLPFTAHLIGMHLKKKHPKIQWLMDIEDPFAYSDAFFVNNFFLYKKLNFRVEKKAFAMADKISLTVETAKDKYLYYFPEYADKLSVNPPLFNLPPKDKKAAPLPYFKANGIHIAYFGAFYATVRTPKNLVHLIAELLIKYPGYTQQLHLHLFGPLDQKMILFFDKNPTVKSICHFHGLINRDEVGQAIQETDFLLNIGNITDYHLPSKSVDYLMSGRPIINLCQHKNDTFKHLLNNYPLILNVHFNKNRASLNIDDVHQFIDITKSKSVEKDSLIQLGKPYFLDNIAANYLKLLERMTDS